MHFERSWPPERRMHGSPLPALRRIGVVMHPTRDVREPLAELGRWACRAGVRVVAAAARGPLPPGIAPVPEASVARESAILLAFGGDGTMLYALAAGSVHGTPVLGVKLGQVNYLAEVEPGALADALEALLLRRFAIEERSVLAVRNGDGTVARVINDVVLRRGSGAPLADVSLHMGGEEVARYRGDGVIVATPTGSTGYSRSAGGPLVSPRLAATIVTPLAAHGTPAQPLLLSGADSIELRLRAASSPLEVELDGRQRFVAHASARLRIDQCEPRCRLIRLGRERFPPRT
jgi:NAD+ kinase